MKQEEMEGVDLRKSAGEKGKEKEQDTGSFDDMHIITEGQEEINRAENKITRELHVKKDLMDADADEVALDGEDSLGEEKLIPDY